MSDPCFQGLYATFANQITFGQTVTLQSGGTTAGALWDLQGNAKGDGGAPDGGCAYAPAGNCSSLSQDMQVLKNDVANGLGSPTVQIAGQTESGNLAGIINYAKLWGAGLIGSASCTVDIGGVLFSSPMAEYLSPLTYPLIFNITPNDGVVSVTSQWPDRAARTPSHGAIRTARADPYHRPHLKRL